MNIQDDIAYNEAQRIVDVSSNIVGIVVIDLFYFFVFIVVLLFCAWLLGTVIDSIRVPLAVYFEKRHKQSVERKIRCGSGANFSGILPESRIQVTSYVNWHPLMRDFIDDRKNYSVWWCQDTLGDCSSSHRMINKGNWFDGMQDNSHQSIHIANGHERELALVDVNKYGEDGIRRPCSIFNAEGYLILLKKERELLERYNIGVFASPWRYASPSDMMALLELIRRNTIVMSDFRFFVFDGDVSCSAHREGNGTVFIELHEHQSPDFLYQLHQSFSPLLSRNI